ncbi:MAG: acyl-ACP--UDP-N-acetylglucosamine O-acyltransferase [Alphaproteobacteria bacterium]|nr:acyl-ACP--UDP-N-acetylglucosamine O-acyltransferase [Alphaproteobacteria bacterium]
MARIDGTAVVADGAVIGDGVEIGPYCVIGPDVVIGAGCRLLAQVSVSGHTTIGEACIIHPFAALGGPPQDLSFRGEPNRLAIGEGCTIREGVTMNIGTLKGGGLTQVGANGFFMNNSHVGHDCKVGNNVIFATSATLGGHCDIGDFVYIGGLSALHQFTRVGPQAMIGGCSGVRGDIIPFGLVSGQHAVLEGLNIVGMKRRQFTKQRLAAVRSFYQQLFHGPGLFADRLEQVRPLGESDPAIAEILAFIDGSSRRPLCFPAVSGS